MPFESLVTLDEFEGVPEHYRRSTVWVEPVGRQARQAAAVYLGQPKRIVADGQPSQDYLDRVAGGARAHGLPRAYVDWLTRAAVLDATGGHREDS
jgi:hypothetical protein